MAKTFRLEIVTPEETAFSANATSLQAPAWEGYLGVLAGHAPLLAVLKPGVVTVRDEAGATSWFAIRGGFMEVTGERTIILADDIEPAKRIDIAAAERALDAASKPGPSETAPQGEKADDRRRLREIAAEEREQERQWAAARVHAVDRLKEGA